MGIATDVCRCDSQRILTIDDDAVAAAQTSTIDTMTYVAVIDSYGGVALYDTVLTALPWSISEEALSTLLPLQVARDAY